jgi:hypothetical protein
VSVVVIAVAAALFVAAVILVILAVRTARQVPELESLVAPDDATVRLDAARRVVAMNERARQLLGRAETDLAQPGAFDGEVLREDRGAGARDVVAAGGTAVPVVYREVAVPRGCVVVMRDRRPEVALDARATAGEQAAADAARTRDEAQARADEFEGRIERLEHQRSLDTAPRGLADALWRLELLRQHRLGWAREPAPATTDLAEPGKRLAGVLATEVELVREDVGTYAELADEVAEAELDGAYALGALRMAQELLAAVAKRSDSITLTVRTAPDAVGLTVTCSGWNPEAGPEPGLEWVAAAAVDLAGALTITEDDGTLLLDVTLPRSVS